MLHALHALQEVYAHHALDANLSEETWIIRSGGAIVLDWKRYEQIKLLVEIRQSTSNRTGLALVVTQCDTGFISLLMFIEEDDIVPPFSLQKALLGLRVPQ